MKDTRIGIEIQIKISAIKKLNGKELETYLYLRCRDNEQRQERVSDWKICVIERERNKTDFPCSMNRKRIYIDKREIKRGRQTERKRENMRESERAREREILYLIY